MSCCRTTICQFCVVITWAAFKWQASLISTGVTQSDTNPKLATTTKRTHSPLLSLS
ncbi:hypothetical protein PF008_g29316 [Phytophthora fragariae]|uniref:RxLR effector protein n=1 Tax=Phytophthora fragariae TaxID=53985 RepID=A0A6G0Q9H0_9STRA|nr:hypothetical protein PF008_g33390 [Phytophthora fragariae]KAE9275592.1 hypothetical protein PF008_g29316 [Phytophthora fragariae]